MPLEEHHLKNAIRARARGKQGLAGSATGGAFAPLFTVAEPNTHDGGWV
jgi:hypothetical protein